LAEHIKTEQDGAVAIVTIDNPPVNALKSALLDELSEELERLDGDDSVRAIVIKGEGEKAFVAGADIKEFPALREAVEQAMQEGGSAPTFWIPRADAPSCIAFSAGSSWRCRATSAWPRRTLSWASRRSSSA